MRDISHADEFIIGSAGNGTGHGGALIKCCVGEHVGPTTGSEMVWS